MSDLIVIDRLLISVFAALLIMAAAYDLKSFRIPNVLSLLMLALYPWHVLFAPEPVDWIMASCVAAAVFAVGVGLFVFGWMGGGDVKLMTAAVLWAGPSMSLDLLFATACIGGVMALFMKTRLRFSLALVFDDHGFEHVRNALLGTVLPYGVAIMAGGLMIAVELFQMTYAV